jgi:hypothetical protein
MDRDNAQIHQFHYHIRWSDKAILDYERFDTRAGAEAGAKQLVRPGESYTIEEHDGACPRCQDTLKAKLSDASV